MKNKYISTRLVLEKLTLNDAPFIFELVNTNEWKQFIGDRNVLNIFLAEEYVKKIIASKNIAYWVIKLNRLQTPVGIITLIKRDFLPHYDIGFAIHPTYSKKGYAYEASKIILDDALNSTMHPAILATTLSQNNRSIQLLEKLGLRFNKEIDVEGVKLLLYSIER